MATGTVRENRKGFPSGLANSVTKRSSEGQSRGLEKRTLYFWNGETQRMSVHSLLVMLPLGRTGLKKKKEMANFKHWIFQYLLCWKIIMQAWGEWTCLSNFCNVIKCCAEQENGGKHCFSFYGVSATNAYSVHKKKLLKVSLTKTSDSL